MTSNIYSQEDAQQILHLAIVRQVESGEITREQLLEIATELDIAPADLEAAEQEWMTQRGDLLERQTFDMVRRDKFRHRLGKYLIVNGFLVAIDFFLIGGLGTLSWSLYLALFGGIGVSLNAWKTYWVTGEEYETAFQRWQQRRKLRKSVGTLLNRWLSV